MVDDRVANGVGAGADLGAIQVEVDVVPLGADAGAPPGARAAHDVFAAGAFEVVDAMDGLFGSDAAIEPRELAGVGDGDAGPAGLVA